MQPPPTRAAILSGNKVRVSAELNAIAADCLRGTTTRSSPRGVIDELREWLSLYGFALTEGKKALGCVGTSAWIDRAAFIALQHGASGGCATLRVRELWVSNVVREKLDQEGSGSIPLLLVHGRDKQVAAFRVERATRVTEESGKAPAKLIEFQLAAWS